MRVKLEYIPIVCLFISLLVLFVCLKEQPTMDGDPPNMHYCHLLSPRFRLSPPCISLITALPTDFSQYVLFQARKCSSLLQIQNKVLVTSRMKTSMTYNFCKTVQVCFSEIYKNIAKIAKLQVFQDCEIWLRL